MSAAPLIADRFELGEFIAQGGMGAVYQGLDRQTGAMVAIKRLKRELITADGSLLARFAREGEALRTLDHRNIVKLLATAEQDSEHYLVLEYVGGGSLADRLRNESKLTIEQTLAIALELADALAHAHHLKIIHRDIKPANVLLAQDGTPRLTDFGVARMAQLGSTTTGVVVGTFAYLAPEVFNGETPDTRADIWAFGVMLFEMLVGQRPFEERQSGALLAAILNQPTPDLEMLCPDAPTPLVDLIYRMLDKDRTQRIGSMRQIAAELEAILTNTPTPFRAARHGTPVDNRDTILTALPPPTPTRDNLPVQTTPFVGREAELTELAKLLGDPATRLITILGSGGMGKTRLALETAATHQSGFIDRAYFVPLAPLTDPELIVSAVAGSVGFQFYEGGSPKQQLLDFFQAKSMLLIFDNFEHLLAGAPLVSDILQTAPNAKIIATSRERLNLHEETLFRIEGMDFPDWETPEDAAEYSAVKLFLQSARRVLPSFALTADDLKYLARICRQVQGMPLGILLAAAWVDNLSLAEISDEIARSLDFLETEARNVPTRQRSIRAAFDYSWNLLNAAERAVFSQLSVFRGGCTREAAQTVTGASLKTLAALVNKSLLRRDPNGRYDMHELLRQYAAAKLTEAPGALDEVCDRHCAYFADFMKRQESRLKSPEELDAIRTIEADFDNVRIAWDCAVDGLDLDALDKAWQSLCLFGWYKTDFQEQHLAFTKAAAALRTDNPAGPRGVLFGCFYALQTFAMGTFVHSWQPEAYALLRRLDATFELAFVLAFAFSGNPAEMLPLYQESLGLFEHLNDQWGQTRAHMILGTVFSDLNLVVESNAHFETAARFAQIVGAPLGYARLRFAQGDAHLAHGEYAESLICYEQALPVFRAYQSTMVVICLGLMGLSATQSKDYTKASAYGQESLTIARASGNSRAITNALTSNGFIYFWQGRYLDAKLHLQEAFELSRMRSSSVGIANCLNNLGHPTVMLAQYTEAEGYFREALGMLDPVLHAGFVSESLIGLAYVTGKCGDVGRGVEVLTFTLNRAKVVANVGAREICEIGELYLTELRAYLSPGDFVAAQDRAESLEFESLVAEILASPPLFPAVG